MEYVFSQEISKTAGASILVFQDMGPQIRELGKHQKRKR